MADLSEDNTIFLATALHEGHILDPQFAVTLLPAAFHYRHDLLELWSFKHFVNRERLRLLDPRLEDSSEHYLKVSL